MGLFKKKVIECPMCKYQFGSSGVDVMHFTEHAFQADEGDYGYTCSLCNETDGMWPNSIGAAAAITLHLSQRHGLQYP
jgi:hypothetical protein